ncbi:mitochondrial import inner membrane translocase subunit TIM8 [Sarotherodon galilaeus]
MTINNTNLTFSPFGSYARKVPSYEYLMSDSVNGPEAPHRAQSLHAPDSSNPSSVVPQQRIKWPPASSRSEWQKFDEDVSNIIQAVAKRDADSRLKTMTTIIVSYASERFGLTKKCNNKTPYTMNLRAMKIHRLRQELRSLKKQFKNADAEEKHALEELHNILRKKLITLRRAEWHRRRGRERARKHAAFIADPFRFSKQLLGVKRSGQLECSAEEVNNFLHETMSDPLREQDLGPNKALINPAPPSVEFKLTEPSLKEVCEVIKAARSASSPGPSGVPYLVYKRCPELLRHLWKILKSTIKIIVCGSPRGRVADQWRYAEGVWIPKEEDSKNINQFRSISLLSVEGKVFFSVVSQRLTEFLLRNNYIDPSVQKGGIPGVPGCLEHTGVVTHLIREAHENRGDLAVLWLDLTNAYGSIPHKLVEHALHLHHVPSKIKDLILDYYANFRLRVTSGAVTSGWHRLGKGIITGCTISSLGKRFDSSLKDSTAIQKGNEELGAWLIKVDKSGLPGRFKAWIYQHSILPRILWPLLVYTVPITTVESLERKISGFLRKWLGLPRSLTSAALYGASNSLQLPFSGLTGEFKVARTREALQYRDSKDCKVASAGIEVRTGRKWKAEKAVEVAESRLRQKTLVGVLATGGAGLGYFPKAQVSRAQGKERHQLLQEEVRAGVEEERVSRAVGLKQQGAWTRWESTLQPNLHLWGKSETPVCPLCSGRGTLEHLLSSCPRALADGRYRWRHDQVLRVVAGKIASAISTSKHHHAPRKAISFIKAGEKPQVRSHLTTGLLNTASDWQLQADLGKQLKFPQNIAKTSLRPDMIIISEASKQLIMLELTVPWEERIEEANERKRGKYQELVQECRGRGWKTFYEPIEVGCRGFAGRSLCKVLGRLGVAGVAKKRVHHCSILSVFVYNGSHHGSTESQSLKNGFVTLSTLPDVSDFVSQLIL